MSTWHVLFVIVFFSLGTVCGQQEDAVDAGESAGRTSQIVPDVIAASQEDVSLDTLGAMQRDAEAEAADEMAEIGDEASLDEDDGMVWTDPNEDGATAQASVPSGTREVVASETDLSPSSDRIPEDAATEDALAADPQADAADPSQEDQLSPGAPNSELRPQTGSADLLEQATTQVEDRLPEHEDTDDAEWHATHSEHSGENEARWHQEEILPAEEDLYDRASTEGQTEQTPQEEMKADTSQEKTNVKPAERPAEEETTGGAQGPGSGIAQSGRPEDLSEWKKLAEDMGLVNTSVQAASPAEPFGGTAEEVAGADAELREHFLQRAAAQEKEQEAARLKSEDAVEQARLNAAAAEEAAAAAAEEARLKAAAAEDEQARLNAAAAEEAAAAAEEEQARLKAAEEAAAAAEEEARLKAAAAEKEARLQAAAAAEEEQARLKAAEEAAVAAEEEARLKAAAAEKEARLQAAAAAEEEQARLNAAAAEEAAAAAAAEEARLKAAAAEEAAAAAAAEEEQARLKAAAEEEEQQQQAKLQAAAAAEEEQAKLQAAAAAEEEEAKLQAAAAAEEEAAEGDATLADQEEPAAPKQPHAASETLAAGELLESSDEEEESPEAIEAHEPAETTEGGAEQEAAAGHTSDGTETTEIGRWEVRGPRIRGMEHESRPEHVPLTRPNRAQPSEEDAPEQCGAGASTCGQDHGAEHPEEEAAEEHALPEQCGTVADQCTQAHRSGAGDGLEEDYAGEGSDSPQSAQQPDDSTDLDNQTRGMPQFGQVMVGSVLELSSSRAEDFGVRLPQLTIVCVALISILISVLACVLLVTLVLPHEILPGGFLESLSRGTVVGSLITMSFGDSTALTSLSQQQFSTQAIANAACSIGSFVCTLVILIGASFCSRGSSSASRLLPTGSALVVQLVQAGWFGLYASSSFVPLSAHGVSVVLMRSPSEFLASFTACLLLLCLRANHHAAIAALWGSALVTISSAAVFFLVPTIEWVHPILAAIAAAGQLYLVCFLVKSWVSKQMPAPLVTFAGSILGIAIAVGVLLLKAPSELIAGWMTGTGSAAQSGFLAGVLGVNTFEDATCYFTVSGIFVFAVLLVCAMQADANQESKPESQAAAPDVVEVAILPDPVRVVGLSLSLRILARVVMGSKRGYGNAASTSRLWRDTVACVRVSARPRSLSMLRTLLHACNGQIDKLDLEHCADQLQNGSLSSLLTRCQPSLTSLSVAGLQIGDSSFQGLSSAVHLVSLKLAGCSQLSDTGLAGFGACVSLVRLDLSNCACVTDVGLRAVVEGCRSIKSLDLSRNAQFTDKTVDVIARGLRELESLNLAGCSLGDTALASLCAEQSALVSIDLSACSSVSDHGLEQLSRQSHKLESLLLTGCHLITDIGICRIAMHSPLLHVLSAENCPQVTAKGVVRLMECCDELTAVYIHGCRAVSEVHVVPSIAQFPHVYLVTKPSSQDDYFVSVYNA